MAIHLKIASSAEDDSMTIGKNFDAQLEDSAPRHLYFIRTAVLFYAEISQKMN